MLRLWLFMLPGRVMVWNQSVSPVISVFRMALVPAASLE